MSHPVRILVQTSPGEVQVAAVAGCKLLDYAIGRPGAPDGVGDLYLGRVIARVPAMGGAFVALPAAEGFLPDQEGGRDVSAGELLAVRVTRAAQGGKGPRLSARARPSDQELGICPRAEAGPRLLCRGPGAVERLAASYPDAPVLVDDAALAAALRPALRDRLERVGLPFGEEVARQVAELAIAEIELPGGARLHLWPTPALTAIDLDAGAASAERVEKRRAQAALNRSVIPALARQIRLRNLSGAILVDFAGLSARRRRALGPALSSALAEDPLRPRLLGFTALGLAEIVRTRVHPPLHELLAGPHAAALAALARAEAELAGTPPLQAELALRAAPDVIAALEADAVALPDFSRRTGRALPRRADPGLPSGSWRLEPLARAD